MLLFDLSKRLDFFNGISGANQTGALLAFLLMVSVGLWGGVLKSKWRGLFTFIVIVLLSFLLVLTTSRGAILAVYASLFVYVFLAKCWSKSLIVGGIIFFFMLLIPGRWDRMQTTAALEGVKSNETRLHVWKGALEIIADNPIVGVDDFWNTYDRWYKPIGVLEKERVVTALNVYLTLGATKGLPAMSLYLALLLIALAYGCWKLHNSQNHYTGSLTIGLLTLAITSFFTYTWHESLLYWLTISLIAALLLHLFIYQWRRLGILLGVYSVITLSVGLLTYALGNYFNAQAPILNEWLNVKNGEGASFEILHIKPQQQETKATLLVLPDRHQQINEIVRIPLRLFAEKGYDVYVCEAAGNDFDMLEKSRILLNSIDVASDAKLEILGLGTSGRIAVKLAVETSKPISRIITVGMFYKSQTIKLPSLENVAASNIPILMLHGEYDHVVPIMDATYQYGIFSSSGINCSLKIIEQSNHYIESKWHMILGFLIP